MEEVESGTQIVTDNIALLLCTGRFSDLTLTCQGHNFFVHRAIVCARSPVWAAAAEGNFNEAKTRVIEVDVADASALQRALAYLYTGVYDDESLPCIEYLRSKTDDSQTRLESEESGIERGCLNDSIQHSRGFETEIEEVGEPVCSPQSEGRGITIETEEPLQCEQSKATISAADDGGPECCTLAKDKPNAICNNLKLRANTFVYILADYYHIPELQCLAVRKFAAALEKVCLRGLGDVCHLVYESAPSTARDLRSCLANAIASHGEQLIEDKSFMVTTLLLPELLRDSFSTLVQQHQATSAHRDAAVAASLKAEDDAKEANTRGQEDKQRAIAQVNQARQCRHCGLENNVLFEREVSYLGRSDYSFRCRCRTRY